MAKLISSLEHHNGLEIDYQWMTSIELALFHKYQRIWTLKNLKIHYYFFGQNILFQMIRYSNIRFKTTYEGQQ